MFRESKPVHSLRCWRNLWEKQVATRLAFGWRSASSAAICAPRCHAGARVAARWGVNHLTLAAMGSEAVSKLRIRIRVCLQTYRNPLKIGSALAAGRRFPKNETVVASQPLGQQLSRLRGTEAAALIEFAVALPLLVVLVVEFSILAELST
jgi:hypothetical protein